MHDRPQIGVGHYLRDIVYGALDGVITTLAVISGVSGAGLAPRIGLILGLANLIGDGFSMGASNYLGLKSELAQTGIADAVEMPWRHGLATMAAFVVFGAVPLIAYFAPSSSGDSRFASAVALAALALVGLGILRARYVRKATWRSTAEVLAIALVAGSAAYAVGALTDSLTS
jgi:VIT1/CCC1 family predicted Fe2+/Mn2+ transporter